MTAFDLQDEQPAAFLMSHLPFLLYKMTLANPAS